MCYQGDEVTVKSRNTHAYTRESADGALGRLRNTKGARQVNASRLPLFCDTALAGRIERVEVQLVAQSSEAARRRRADAAGFVIPISGGVASFAEEGSPFNKVAGLGFGGVPDLLYTRAVLVKQP